MGSGRIEFELKFTGPPGELAMLPQSRFFAAINPGGGAWERLTSTYFDTADHALSRAGLSLRLREEGAEFVQAVKARRAHPAERDEYETLLEDEEAFPAATGVARIDQSIQAVSSALVPIARTRVDRWAAQIRYKGAEIEIALDLGQAESLDSEGRKYTGSLAEVELELISGEPAAVYDFARLLLDNCRLRIAAASKLEAALALQRPDRPIPKRRKRESGAEPAAADLLASALSDCATRLAQLQETVVDLRRPEGVHQMRVALRRLRATERIFRRDLKTDDIERLAARAKHLASLLGPARDWDVFLSDTLSIPRNREYAPQGFKLLKARGSSERAAAWAVAVEAVSSREFTDLLLDLSEASVLQRWRSDCGKSLERSAKAYAPSVLDRALKKARKAAGAIQGVRDIADLHKLRIALKKLRYPAQLFKDFYPKEARKEFMSALAAMQEALGAVNDAVVAQDLADRAAGGGDAAMRAAGFISGYRAAKAREAAKKIDAAFGAFEKIKPFWRDQ